MEDTQIPSHRSTVTAREITQLYQKMEIVHRSWEEVTWTLNRSLRLMKWTLPFLMVTELFTTEKYLYVYSYLCITVVVPIHLIKKQFELRTQESAEKPNDVGTTEGVKVCLTSGCLYSNYSFPTKQTNNQVKVLAMGEESGPTSLRIELSSECDLFFQYTCNINQQGYEDLRQEQDLMCDIKDFAHTLMRMLNKCIKESSSYALLILQREGNAVLQFIQNMEYKYVELLQLPFKESPEFVIRQQISYRYNALKARLSMMQARLQDVNALVKVKNPSLLLQLQRSYEDTYQ